MLLIFSWLWQLKNIKTLHTNSILYIAYRPEDHYDIHLEVTLEFKNYFLQLYTVH